MRSFYLDRSVDDSGVSGTGIVAEGTCFDTGQSVVCWFKGPIHSMTFYNSIEEVEKIHGHGSHTKIIWVGEEARLNENPVINRVTMFMRLTQLVKPLLSHWSWSRH